MVLEAGIISWLLYFLIDNTSLSVYNHTNNKQSLALADKVKEEVKKDEPTYTKPKETTANAEMSNDQLEEFLSNAI